MILISLGITLTIVIILNCPALVRKNNSVGLSAALSGVMGALCGIGCTSAPLAIALFLVAGVGFACWMLGARQRWFAVSSVITTIAAYAVMAWIFAVPNLRGWEQAKEKYPLESIEDRLAYETRPGVSPKSSAASADPQRLTSMESELDRRNEAGNGMLRVICLEKMHAGTVRQFIAAPGFGVGRQIRPLTPSHMDHFESRDESNRPRTPIPQPVPIGWDSDMSRGELSPADDSNRRTHLASVLDFLNPVDFGYVRDRQHVAGFRPHAFHMEPTATGNWHIERLELVGILKHDEPVVYLTRDFPRMEEVRDAPLRKLDLFEVKALSALQSGEDLMVQEESTHLRMFGSIRAVNQCLKCHNVERGELLGAFSYQLSH